MDITQLYQLFTEHPVISIDSRKINKNSLFFALKGENHDANYFAGNALANGASLAIVDNPEVVESDKYILVDDVLHTLQQLALHHRKQYNIPVLAITGSNGKTTTKELISNVLSKKYNILFTRGNLNNHIGLPLTILELNSSHEIAIFEIGANHIGEIEKLCQLALPTYGLITNIGHAHLEGFGSFEGVVTAKTELYKFIGQQLGKVFVNICDDLLTTHAGDISRVFYGLDPSADYRGEILQHHPFLGFMCSENSTAFEVQTQLTGAYNANNVMAAVCIGRYFGVSVGDVVNAITSYKPQNNRSQVFDTGKNHLILDAYNANPSSMVAALDNFSNYPGDRKMCILGDMLELGEYAYAEHQKIIELAKNSGFEKVVCVGEHFFKHRFDDPAFRFFADTRLAAEWFADQETNGYTILIKGSRKIQLETMVELL
jgi:UDP-N-acetylmuramoyl-tripeptide--D-alanyl-D-alanine ligase